MENNKDILTNKTNSGYKLVWYMRSYIREEQVESLWFLNPKTKSVCMCRRFGEHWGDLSPVDIITSRRVVFEK